jgi:peptidylprolyl isomerase
VPTNQQRRDAERRRLQRQLEQRRAREAARKRMTLIGSIVGTLVIIAGVVIAIVLTNGGGSGKNKSAAGNPSTSPSPTTSSSSALTSSPAPVPNPTAPCAGVPKGTTATFKGVTVKGAADLKHAPKVTSKGTATPATLQCQDLVVGKGKPATPASTVSVQYTGALYKNGKVFDSSWSRGGKPVQFSLAQVVKGFTQGIGGAGKVSPMRVGGRRVMILPASLGYGAQAQGPIPANSTLVFVVDLTGVTG